MFKSHSKILKNCLTIFNYLKTSLISLKNNSFNIRTVLNNSSIWKLYKSEISTVKESSKLSIYYNSSLNMNDDNNSNNINNFKILNINNFLYNNLNANILLSDMSSFSADLIQI